MSVDPMLPQTAERQQPAEGSVALDCVAAWGPLSCVLSHASYAVHCDFWGAAVSSCMTVSAVQCAVCTTYCRYKLFYRMLVGMSVDQGTFLFAFCALY